MLFRSKPGLVDGMEPGSRIPRTCARGTRFHLVRRDPLTSCDQPFRSVLHREAPYATFHPRVDTNPPGNQVVYAPNGTVQSLFPDVESPYYPTCLLTPRQDTNIQSVFAFIAFCPFHLTHSLSCRSCPPTPRPPDHLEPQRYHML